MGADLGVPLSDLRLLCGSIDGWGGGALLYVCDIWAWFRARGIHASMIRGRCSNQKCGRCVVLLRVAEPNLFREKNKKENVQKTRERGRCPHPREMDDIKLVQAWYTSYTADPACHQDFRRRHLTHRACRLSQLDVTLQVRRRFQAEDIDVRSKLNLVPDDSDYRENVIVKQDCRALPLNLHESQHLTRLQS